MDRQILRQWLRAGFIEKHVWHPTNTGTPQGGIISPVLMNLTLDGLQQCLQRRFRRTKVRNGMVNMVRWADDFIITGSSKELLEHEVKPLVEAFLSERGLTLSPEKTHITHIDAGFDFLGQHIRKYGGTYLAQPAKKNVKAFLEKVRDIMKSNKQATAGHLILRLNPVIRGWAHYHRHSASKRTFDKVDSAIFEALWRWAKRRHPHKPQAGSSGSTSARWISGNGSFRGTSWMPKENAWPPTCAKQPRCRSSAIPSSKRMPIPTTRAGKNTSNTD